MYYAYKEPVWWGIEVSEAGLFQCGRSRKTLKWQGEENYVCAAKPIHCERKRVSEWMDVLHFINPELFDPIHTWPDINIHFSKPFTVLP